MSAEPTPAAPARPALHEVPPAVPERWAGVTRPYAEKDVDRLRGSVRIAYTLAEMGAKRLWELLHTRPFPESFNWTTPYGVAADGRFLRILPAQPEAPLTSIDIVLNWAAELDAPRRGGGSQP